MSSIARAVSDGSDIRGNAFFDATVGEAKRFRTTTRAQNGDFRLRNICYTKFRDCLPERR